MNYAPYHPEFPFRPDAEILQEIGRDINRSLRKRGSSGGLAQPALYEFLAGRFDNSIQYLQSLIDGEDAENWLWSDLAVLHLARAREEAQSYDLLEALAAASRSLEGENVPLEALFNQALVLHKLSLISQARAAWEEYLKRDRDSAWAEEARSYLRDLNEIDAVSTWKERRKALSAAALEGNLESVLVTVGEFPQAAREYAEKELLGYWAREWIRDRPKEADQHLAIARQIGSALTQTRGDHMVSDSVAVIDNAVASKDLEGLADLARPHWLYLQGLEAYDSGLYDKARPLFDQARTAFASARSPFYLWASLRSAICDLQQFRYPAAERAFQDLSRTLRQDRYPALHGAISWSLGLTHGFAANPAAAIQEYRTALEAFGRIGESQNRALVERLMAESLRLLGDTHSAWNHLSRALQAAPQFVNARERYPIYSEAAALAKELDLPRVVLAFMEESLAGLSRANVLSLVVGLRRKAALCAELGLAKEAREAIAEARGILPTITDPSAQATLQGDFLAAEGELLLKENPRQAVDILNSAIRLYEDTQYRYQLTRLLFLRARAFAVLGRLDLAERDLGRSIEAVEEERRRVPQGEAESYLDERREIYDEMARVQVDLHRPDKSLFYVEQARARSLRESLALSIRHSEPSRAPLSPVSIDHLRVQLPESAVLIEYAIFGKVLFVWLIRKDSIEVVQLTSSLREVELAIERLRRFGLERLDEASFRSQSEIIFEAIFRPLLSHIRLGDHLVFVPDGILHAIPFGALFDREARRYLIQDFTVAVAPSATVYVIALQQKRHAARLPVASALVMGAPDVNRRAWPSLPSLPGTEDEVREIASLYPRAQILVGSFATPEAFVREVGQYDVVHIATHALSNAQHPSLALLVLSQAGVQETGALYARDLYSLRLTATRLVVLSSCGSLGGPIGETEGVFSLARPFLAAGVPTVVGTLWRIDDGQSQEITLRFHRWLRKGLDASSALRATQRELIEEEKPLRTWAAFQVVGV